MKVLYFSAECKPFSKAGGVGDVAGELPWALKKMGVDIEVVTPYYGFISDKHFKKSQDYQILFNGKKENVQIFQTELDSVKVNFIKNSNYFEGYYSSIYINSPLIPYYDDALRFSFFCEACIPFIEKKNPHIVHINDWLLGYLFGRMEMTGMKQSRALTIHNVVYQGNIGNDVISTWDMAQLSSHPLVGPLFCDPNPTYNSVNPLRLGIELAHKVNTVSPNYCTEICTPENTERLFLGGKGLDKICRNKQKQGGLVGILNGYNYKVKPRKDDFFDILKNKKESRDALTKDFKEPVQFLLGFVGRAVEQKLKLLTLELEGKSVLEHILDIPGVGVAVLATGEKHYEEFLKKFNHKPNYSSTIAFDKNKARNISLGCDLFLMPSLFEPCGITQLESMQNATLPLVRWTGGLKDTVIPHTNPNGTGFGFDGQSQQEILQNLLKAVKTACQLFTNKRKAFEKLQRRAFDQRFSWSSAATHYISKLYSPLVK